MKGQTMTILLTIPALMAAAFLAFALWVRLAPHDPAVWHVDPAATPDPASPNFARRTVESPLPPNAVRAHIDRAARAEGATLLAGDEMHFTYVARTRLMRYPDLVSFRLIPVDGGGTRLMALSRARFGHSDMGVNAARLDRWLAGV
ncbi:MAG: DUF1499 domain-containing protein [Pararhodobacter sp.]|nr:DUF1499 domain-containing protein [Pararhodobacter sp.]